jgi:catechol 2,3-dioxygenase-like lactoylglutathione lyase family enzyme
MKGKPMKMQSFDHVNVRTAKLQVMVDWYSDVLGLVSGRRPNFPFGGAWMYLDDLAILHLVDEAENPANTDPKIEHFALRATGLTEFLAHLAARDIDVSLFEVEGFGITQVNIFDPDGNHIHIDFHNESKG